MSREWVDDMKKKPVDKRWVMRCDVGLFGPVPRCKTQGEPSRAQPDLQTYADAGWFIAEVHGDVCPSCLAGGYVPMRSPHKVMNTTKESAQ